ncbi:MAG: peptidoglycan recognition family protein [Nitriliruptoraceae bacterium]
MMDYPRKAGAPSAGSQTALTRRRALLLAAGGVAAIAGGLLPRWLRNATDEGDSAGPIEADRHEAHDDTDAPGSGDGDQEGPFDGADAQGHEEDGRESETGDGGEQSDESLAAMAPTVLVICREALGLAAARPDSRIHDIRTLTLHHTAVRLDEAGQAPDRLRGHQRFHMDQGWPDIAYHFGVDLAGNVYELRNPSIPGDTFTDYDPEGHFLVVCEGDFNVQVPTDAMLDSVTSLFAYAADHYGVAVDTIAGHRDYASTACPGDDLYARLGEISSAARALVSATPPVLDRLCGEAAVTRVSQIESGTVIDIRPS